MFLKSIKAPVSIHPERKSLYDIWAAHTDPELRELGIQALKQERKNLETEVEANRLRSKNVRTFFKIEWLATGGLVAFVGVATESSPLVASGLAVGLVGYVASKNYEPTTHAAAAQEYIDSLLGTELPSTAHQQPAATISQIA
jgi:hypothetical protein